MIDPHNSLLRGSHYSPCQPFKGGEGITGEGMGCAEAWEPSLGGAVGGAGPEQGSHTAAVRALRRLLGDLTLRWAPGRTGRWASSFLCLQT